MLQYIKDRYKSRKLWFDEWTQCEWENCHREWVDKHHIVSSSRWKRKHEKDWSDIINLCLYHHEYIHNHNTFENRQMLLSRVRNILFALK